MLLRDHAVDLAYREGEGLGWVQAANLPHLVKYIFRVHLMPNHAIFVEDIHAAPVAEYPEFTLLLIGSVR
jgi:hypothetical protein